MTTSLEPYLDCIQATLEAACCVRNFPSRQAERHNKPEIEANQNPELILKPVTISRSPGEKCYIEPSINSVRVSITIKKNDSLDALLVKRFMRFLQLRANQFSVVRRKPCPDPEDPSKSFDMSFLITNFHMELMPKQNLIEFIIFFLTEINKTINEMKLAVNTRGRLVAKTFLSSFGQVSSE